MTSSFKWSGIVKARADEWGVEVIVSDNKAKDLKDITSRKTYSVIYYVGDGPEDIEVIDIVDKFFAPKNSRPEILELKDRDNFIYIPVEGGEGVLDYVKDYILR
jgi:3-deoxy-D-manno-octulosonate 8-phosphate phosphatase KdsC-like HAD superfamily phosphatase